MAPPANLKLFTPEAFTDLLPSINTAEGQRAIDEMIGTDWDVIFIDNYSAWSGDGRETAEAWAPMMRWMLSHKRAGRTVIVIHHTGKTGKQRGSSSHEDALDWSVALKPVEDVAGDGALRFNLVWEKSRHLANTEVQPIAATLRQGESGDVSWHHKEGLHRDPRSIAKAAEGYALAQGIADTIYFGPEAEFFLFDDVRFKVDMNEVSYKIDDIEGPYNSGREYPQGNMGHRPRVKGGYFPDSLVDS